MKSNSQLSNVTLERHSSVISEVVKQAMQLLKDPTVGAVTFDFNGATFLAEKGVKSVKLVKHSSIINETIDQAMMLLECEGIEAVEFSFNGATVVVEKGMSYNKAYKAYTDALEEIRN